MSERTMINLECAGKATTGSQDAPAGGNVRAIAVPWRGWQSVGLSWLSQVFSGTPANLPLDNAAAKRVAGDAFRGTVVSVRGKAKANARRLSEQG